MKKKVYKILRNDSLAEEQNINTMSFSSPRLQYPPEDYIVGFGEKRMLLCRNSKIMSLPIKRDKRGNLLEFAITQEVTQEDGK